MTDGDLPTGEADMATATGSAAASAAKKQTATIASWNILADGLSLDEFISWGGDAANVYWHRRRHDVVRCLRGLFDEVGCDVIVTQENDHPDWILSQMAPSVRMSFRVEGKNARKFYVNRLSNALTLGGHYESTICEFGCNGDAPGCSMQADCIAEHARKANDFLKQHAEVRISMTERHGCTCFTNKQEGAVNPLGLDGEMTGPDDLHLTNDCLAVYYNSDRVRLVSDNQEQLESENNVWKLVFQLQTTPLPSNEPTYEFTVFPAHLKSGEDAEGEQQRVEELEPILDAAEGVVNPVVAMDSNTSYQYEKTIKKEKMKVAAKTREEQAHPQPPPPPKNEAQEKKGCLKSVLSFVRKSPPKPQKETRKELTRETSKRATSLPSGPLERTVSSPKEFVSDLFTSRGYRDVIFNQKGEHFSEQEERGRTQSFKMRHAKGAQPKKWGILFFDRIDKILVPRQTTAHEVRIPQTVFAKYTASYEYVLTCIRGSRQLRDKLRSVSVNDRWGPDMNLNSTAVLDQYLLQGHRENEEEEEEEAAYHHDSMVKEIIKRLPGKSMKPILMELYPKDGAPSDHPPVAARIKLEPTVVTTTSGKKPQLVKRWKTDSEAVVVQKEAGVTKPDKVRRSKTDPERLSTGSVENQKRERQSVVPNREEAL